MAVQQNRHRTVVLDADHHVCLEDAFLYVEAVLPHPADHLLIQFMGFLRTGSFRESGPPAFSGIRQQRENIQKIVDSPDSATFENTILAYEESGRMLDRVGR